MRYSRRAWSLNVSTLSYCVNTCVPAMQLFRSTYRQRSSRVFTEYLKAKRRGDFDQAILVIDVDQHQKLDEVLRECQSSTAVDAVVTNHASNYGCCGIPLTDERIRKLATASDSRAATVSRGTRTSTARSRLLRFPEAVNEHNKPGRPSCQTRRARTLPRPCPGSST